ncbi:zinc ribbon domain-containing protein [Lactobacillus sp.]|uniref:zinc ribbon domain-containing protein n=1 Tax=Lactobacillus sp. TaxID=1591 RepID=UPI00199380A3|nr:zinc ribbon domain-containing protein [Lactobacillus sp.]MBD5430685.1 zinc ribbon domain-containing protein [Lactobacillus sp.]
MKCPNCGQNINENDEKCSHCGFNLKKFHEEFLTDKQVQETNKDEKDTPKMTRRTIREEEFTPKKQNSTVAAMITWIRVNATIVFLVGILLLILMSFSRLLGWFSFFALMIWLFVVCDKNKKPEQYTVDKRLTQKVNKVSSDVVNSFEQGESKIKSHKARLDNKLGKDSNSKPIKIKQKRTASQFGVILMAALSLLTVFYGPFSSSSMESFQALSISKMLLNLGGLGGKYSLIGYGLWLVFVLFPIIVIVVTLRNKKYNRQLTFGLAVIETIILFICAFELIFLNAGKSIGITDSSVVSDAKAQQMIANAISFGISTYLLFISSILTTLIAGKNLKK